MQSDPDTLDLIDLTTDTQGKATPLAQSLESLSGIGTWQVDAMGEVTLSPVAARMMQRRRDGRISLSLLLEWVHPSDRTHLTRVLNEALDEGHAFDLVHRIALPSGELRWIHARGHGNVDPTGNPHVVGLFRDITTTDRTAQARRFGWGTDPLTGLPMRNGLLQRLSDRDDGDHPGTLTLLDVLDFRRLNVEFGIQVCDLRLAGFARRLVRLHGQNNVFRIGPDSFAVLSEATAAEVNEQVQRAWLQSGGGRPGPGCATVEARGLVKDEKDLAALETLLEHSDEGLPTAAPSSRINAQQLRTAIEQNQLHLAYQPKVELVTGRVLSFEALARWVHPDLGFVSPAEFIPLAEASGLIHELGRWAMQEACEQLATWNRTGLTRTPLSVAVNVSPVQFDGPLAAMLEDVLHTTDIDPSRLTLEVTESTIMRSPEAAVRLLTQLRELGVKISVDDFGTGHSSLATIKSLPLDQLKIDRAFVSGLGINREDTAICSAVVAIAHSLGLDVVAEGAETQQHIDELRRLGVEHVQGYHYSKPVTADEVPATLRRLASEATSTDEAEFTTVLVVDDAIDVRQLATMSLESDGFAVAIAGTGREALEVAAEVEPTVVLLDVSLPDARGYDVCRALREAPGGQDRTILMLSSHGESTVKAESFAAGADDYLVKPVSPRDLVARVHLAISRKRLATPRE